MIENAFRLETPRGDVLRGEVRIREGPPPRSAVVVVHGFKGFKDWGFFPWVCRRLAGDGHAVVSFNFSHNGIGDDPVAFTELERFAANRYTLELEELARVVERVREGALTPRPPDRLGVLGHSRGGADALLHAASDPHVDAVVTWAAVATLDRWTPETREEWRETGRVYVLNSRTGQQMPLDVGLLDDFEAHRARLDVTAAAERVRAPWLVVHGTEDTTVDPEEARTLARRGPRARLTLVEGAGHTFEVGHPFGEPSSELERALEASARHLRRYLGEGG